MAKDGLQVMPQYDKRDAFVWDCGSSLYDSYELTTFKRQLDAAVLSSARSFSMPHLPAPPPPPPSQRPASGAPKKRARLPKLLHKLFLKVLRLRPGAAAQSAPYDPDDRYRMAGERYSCGGGGSSSWSSGALTSIPEESSEKGSPEAGPSAIRRAQSERFARSKATVVHLEVLL